MVQLGAGSLEMHNNVVYQAASGSAPAIVRENPASEVDTPFCAPFDKNPWAAGRNVFGTGNWVQNSASLVPVEWTGTRRGNDPLLTNIAQRNLRPRSGSPLVDAGNNAPASPANFPYPSPLPVPVSDPPLRMKMAIGGQQARAWGGRIDIGALEDGVSTAQPRPMNGAQPLIPPKSGTASARDTVDLAAVPASRDIATPPADRAQEKPQRNFVVRWWRNLQRWFDGLARKLRN
jgi:hypothetical protein